MAELSSSIVIILKYFIHGSFIKFMLLNGKQAKPLPFSVLTTTSKGRRINNLLKKQTH
jgi:hypothetical protein